MYKTIYTCSFWSPIPILPAQQGLVNVPIEHHPTIGDINSNRHLKVIFKIPLKRDIYQPLLKITRTTAAIRPAARTPAARWTLCASAAPSDAPRPADFVADFLFRQGKCLENGHRNSGFTHWTWWFSMVMLVERVRYDKISVPNVFCLLMILVYFSWFWLFKTY